MVGHRFFLILLVFTVAFKFGGAEAIAASSGITYQGRILKPDGQPLSGTQVRFKLALRSPGAEDCLLFEEIQAPIDMSDSNGLFSITMNNGNGVRSDASGYTVDQLFANRGTFTVPAGYCASGTTYAPNLADGRRLAVSFKDETMAAWEPMPVQLINYVPLAIEAKQIAGFSAKNLLRFAEADGTLVNTSPLDNAQYNELLALLAGTSTQYEQAGRLNGTTIPAMTSGHVLSWNGTAWTSADPLAGVQAFAKTALPDCDPNEFLTDNGSGLLTCVGVSGSSGGTVTQVDTGTGLTGGGFTTTGTISIAPGGVSTTELADDAVTSAKIDDGTITGSDLATNIAITTTGALSAGNISGADIAASGNLTVGGNATVTGNVTAANVSSTAVATRDLQLVDPDDVTAGAKRISIKAPLALAADYTLIWPLNDGSNGEVLTTDGSGNLTWSSVSSGGITALTGDVTASGTGSVTATIANNAITTAKITDKNVTYAKIQDVTSQRILGRAAAGNGVIEEITVGAGLNLSAGGALTATGIQALVGSALTNGKIWVGDGSSLAQEVTPAGDVTMTNAGSFTVATVGGSTAANIATGEALANAATAANTNDAIVKRDSAGAFVSASAKLTSSLILKDGATGGEITIATPTGFTNYGLTLPANDGSAGEFLQTNGSGVLTWAAAGAASGVGDFLKDGSVAMTGTLKANAGTAALPGYTFTGFTGTGMFETGTDILGFSTAGAERMRINASGNVGIGTSSPSQALHVHDGQILVDDTSGGDPALTLRGTGVYQGTIAMNNGTPNDYINGDQGGNLDILSNNGILFSGNGWDHHLTILSSGNVGIGTTAPARALHVVGPIRMTASTAPSSPATGDIYVDSSDSNKLKWYNGSAWQSAGGSGASGDFMKDGSVAMTGNFNAGGNSILGNTTASANLTLESTSNATKGHVVLQPNGGYVGIGTATPDVALSVIGDGSFVNDQNGWSTLSLTNATAGASASISLDISSDTARGSLWIPSSTYGTAALRNRFIMETSSTSSGVSIVSAGASGDTRFMTGGNVERMRIASSGNVGIGVTSPDRLLHVAGPMRVAASTVPSSPATGDIYVDSSDSNKLKWYNGSAWQTAGSAAGAGDFMKDGSVAMTGDIELPVGAVGTPSLDFTGDTTTGIYRASAGVIGFSSAGVNSMSIGGANGLDVNSMIQAAGQISTSSSNGTIYAATSASEITPNAASKSGTIQIYNTSTGGNGKGAFYLTRVSNSSSLSQNAYFGAISTTGAANYSPALVFGQQTGAAAYAERMRIDENGNVGIGTTSTGAKLDVKGSFAMSGSTSGAVKFAVPAAAGSATYTWPSATPASNMVLQSDNTGALSWVTAGGGGLTNFTEAVNTAAPNATIPVVSLTATNAAASVDIALVPKGTGSLTADIADGTATGGDKRGTGAVDWQTSRSNTAYVASGNYSAIGGGVSNTASGGWSSVAGGSQNTAAGNYAGVLAGNLNQANGVNSAVLNGYLNIATGNYSLVAGRNATAESYMQTTVGTYNLPLGSESASTWVATDPLFVVGNGTAAASRANAFMVLKNGNVGVGTAPASTVKLDVAGQIVSRANAIASGATVDLSTSNTQVLSSVGGSTITLSNLKHGGQYTMVIRDTTSRTYTFSGCTTSKFKPTNAATTASSETIYTILSIDNGAGGFICYITWSSGF